MSVSTPILTLTCWALAVPQANTTARAAQLIVRFIDVSSLLTFFLRQLLLHAEIVVHLLHIAVQFGIGELVDNTSMFHDVVVIRDHRCEAEIHKADMLACPKCPGFPKRIGPGPPFGAPFLHPALAIRNAVASVAASVRRDR